MRKQSIQAAFLMTVFFVFIVLLTTASVKLEVEGVSERSALPLPSHRSHRRDENQETVLEIVPKDANEDPYAGKHYEARHEGDSHTLSSTQSDPTAEESHVRHHEVRNEDIYHTAREKESPVSVVVEGRPEENNSSNNKSSQPAQPTHRDRGKVSVLRVPSS